jgi:hypothetical protein
MSILNKIKTGRVPRAQKVVLYAPEGFGKSTLASQFPEPLFLDVEDSTAQMEVARIGPDDLPDLAAFESALAEIIKAKPCKTLVVDTIDWLEEMALRAVIKEAGNPKITGIEDFGYGKGYTILKERMTLLLNKLDRVLAAGIHVVLLAHSKVVKFEPPDGAGPFDRYELKLSKQVAPIVKEWADMLLFGNWRTQVKERDKHESGAQYKAVGGKERMMYCTRLAAWDAKNRHGMKDAEKWEIASIAAAFNLVGAPWEKTTLGVMEVNQEVPMVETPKVEEVKTEPGKSVSAERQSHAPAPIATEPEQIPSGVGWGGPTVKQDTIPGTPMDAELERIVAPHAAAVTAYLVKAGKIGKGQTWADMPAEFAARIKRNPARFLEVVGVEGRAA